ncbi:hypothetical protein GGR57DRAFT_512381 [Xylariaceae sp. FL1272]|nr:hypothetical protein GGR57DRAFT_512381 [Xylariaceae sp. FL1272]
MPSEGKKEYTEEERAQRAARKRARTCWVTGASEEAKERAVRLALNQVSGGRKYSWLNQQPETPAQSLGTSRALELGITRGKIAKDLQIGNYRPNLNKLNEAEKPRLELVSDIWPVINQKPNVQALRGMGLNLTVEEAEQMMRDCGQDEEDIERFRAANSCTTGNSGTNKLGTSFEDDVTEGEEKELEEMYLAYDVEKEMTQQDIDAKEEKRLEEMFLACVVEQDKSDSLNPPTNSHKEPANTKKGKRGNPAKENNEPAGAKGADNNVDQVSRAAHHRNKRAEQVSKKRKIKDAQENDWRAEHQAKKKRGLEIEKRRAAEAAKKRQSLQDQGSSKDCPIEL